jgi:predicted metalloprotease with PDZ domain
MGPTPLLLALLVAVQDAPAPGLDFDVEIPDPESGALRVSLTVKGNAADDVRVAMPAWAPGAYRIVTYAKALKGMTASRPGGTKGLPVRSVDEQTWVVDTDGAPVFTVSYELAVERSRMDKDHCYLAGPDTYLYVDGRKDLPCRVRFKLPAGWDVGTGLDREGEYWGARDYDTFIDCPTELGRFERLSFQEDGATYELVIHSKGPVDGAKLLSMCRKIVVEQNRIFGGPPFKRYVFLYHFRDGIGGRGLEHLNSTDISMSYAAVRAQPLLAASVTSHEYFHLWNVKRIRPFELGPFDYAKPVRSKALWFCEGVTSYFGDRTLARVGIWPEAGYFAHLSQEIEALQNNPDRKLTPVEQASWTVWDRKDWPRVDYYNKGELLGLLIDLRMRTESDGARTFDDVLRRLYEQYVVEPAKAGKGWIGVGYPEDGLLRALNEVSGRDWTPFYDRHIRGVDELPYEEILRPAGLDPLIAVTRSPDLGVELRGTVVMSVPAGGAAEQAGIRANDRVTAIAGVEVTRSNLRDVLAKHAPGEELALQLVRGEAPLEVALKVGVRERTTCRLRRAEQPSPAQKKLLDAWLGRRTDF